MLGALFSPSKARSSIVALLLLCAAAVAQTVRLNLYFFASSESFSTTGRWIPADPNDKAAYPSETEVDCDRQARSCLEATAEYYSGHPHVSTVFYQIVKWDGNGLIATSADGICMTKTLIVGFPNKSIFASYSMKKLDHDVADACKTMGTTGMQNDVFVIKNSDRWKENPYGSDNH